MLPRKDTSKGKATSTAPSKAKATFAPPPKKRKGGEATSSQGEGLQAVAALAATRQQPQGQREFCTKSMPPHVKDWYKRCRPKHIHAEDAIHERRLKAKYQAIWRGINELGLSYVLKNTGDINVNLVREFYAGFDPEDPEQLVPIRGRLIDFSTSAICNFLVLAPSLRIMDLTNVRAKEENTTTSLTGAEHNAHDDSFMAHLYGMMDLQLRIGGRPTTMEKRTILEERFPLNAHAQQLVGLGDKYKLPADEDVNTPEQSEAEPEQSDDEDDDDEEEAQEEEWAASEAEGDDVV
ncbi:hypothetical protein A4A49_05613 [Nicotiana attenuata]|uniref:Uncharacterized protein n=1 Tax=Nicotiana attenuata TaxID=49451 RepID=A0A314LI28_NICAT|nr:hypothetical protein A4A49_05613 [Nicotiana attenuata]